MFYIINPVRTAYNIILIANYFNYKTCAVWTDQEIKNKWANGLYDENQHTYEIYLDELDEFLTKHPPLGFIPGDDLSVKITDLYQHKFFPNKSNDFSLYHIRNSKFEYYNRLKEFNLIKTEQKIYTSNCEFKFPCIMKPLISEGGKNTFLINSALEAESIQKNHPDVKFILQSFLEGTEYSVDFCSFGNSHKILGVWKYSKDEGNLFREEIDLLEPFNPIVDIIFNYMIKILDCLGVHIGLTHSEVIINNNNEVSLVEINFRQHGHLGAIMQKTSIGTNQFIESFNSYNGKNINQHIKFYNYNAPIKKILINNKKEKHFEKIPWEEIENLNSVKQIYKHDMFFNLPNTIPITKDVGTSLGYVMIQNNNLNEFNSDIEKILLWKNKITN